MISVSGAAPKHYGAMHQSEYQWEGEVCMLCVLARKATSRPSFCVDWVTLLYRRGKESCHECTNKPLREKYTGHLRDAA